MRALRFDGVVIRAVPESPYVAELVLDRPEALNAVSTQQGRDIAAATDALGADADVRAVVLSSSSARAFCVGADLKERAGLDDDGLRANRAVTRGAYGGVLGLPMPVVAAVAGYALGGGLELALACDLLVVDATAVVGLPEVSVGLIPGGGGTQLLSRRVGLARAADLILTARRVDAEEAYRLGVADRLVPAGQARTTAVELAAGIAANSPVGVRNAKRAMRLGSTLDLAAALEVEDALWRATAFSPDRREGIAAFVEHRSPHWPAAQDAHRRPG